MTKNASCRPGSRAGAASTSHYADMHAAMRGAGIVSTSAGDAVCRAVEAGSRVCPRAPGLLQLHCVNAGVSTFTQELGQGMTQALANVLCPVVNEDLSVGELTGKFEVSQCATLQVVAAPLGTDFVVLQMPRGNLETVWPRALVLAALANVLLVGRAGAEPAI